MLYLAWLGGTPLESFDVGPWESTFRLDPALVLVDSEASRSVVYHALKDLLPRGTALLVAPLADAPKAKGMAPGAQAWLRERREPPKRSRGGP